MTWRRWVAALLVTSLALPACATDGDLCARLGLRCELGGFLEGQAVVRGDRDSPRQRPGLLGVVRGKVGRPKRFAVFVDLRTLVGGPPEGAHGIGFVHASDVFQNVSPAVDLAEAYTDVFLGRVDLRIGKQKITWGRLDGYSPADVVNPRAFLDPIQVTGNDAKVGVPALRATAYPFDLGDLVREPSIGLVWVPVPMTPRFPLENERWFPPQTSVGNLVFPPDTLPSPIPGTRIPEVHVRTDFTAQNRSPAHRLDEGAVGLRLGGITGGADWGLVFYDGPETAPAFDFQTSLFSPSARRRFQEPDPIPDIDDLRRLRADVVVLPRFGRIRLVGGDMAMRLDDLTLRAEAAFGQDRLLPRGSEQLITVANVRRALAGRELEVGTRLLTGQRARVDLGPLFVARDVVEWGVGADTLLGGFSLIAQLNQTIILDNDTPLLLSNVDTTILGIVRRSLLSERLLLEAFVLQGLARGYTLGVASASYAVTDALRVRVGGAVIAGSRRSLVGQFHDNDEAFFQLRYAW